ncbi:Probable alkaline/neutral invertase B [Linum perenne]
MNGEYEVVKNFLMKTIHLQSWEKTVDHFKLGEGVMPASFKVLHKPEKNIETLIADFGETAIGRRRMASPDLKNRSRRLDGFLILS